MAIVNKDGYNFLDGLNSDYIVIEENRLSDYIKYINNNDIKKIYIMDLDDNYKKDSIDFLKECPRITGVNIGSDRIIDYSGLYALKQLEILLFDEAKSEIDLTKMPKLKDLRFNWNKYVKGLTECHTLIELGIWKYKPKTKDLSELQGLTNIKELIITQGNIESFKGLRGLNKLMKFEINYLKNLEIINELEFISHNLKHLRFYACKSIKNYDYVTCLNELELLSFGNCGDIPSLKFIKKIPKLKSFIFTETNIIDGDISWCKGLDYVAFSNRRNFNMKFEDFKKINKDITRIQI